MEKICAIQMDNIENINIAVDSTHLIGCEAIKRGYKLFIYEPSDLCLENGVVYAIGRFMVFDENIKNKYEYTSPMIKFELKNASVLHIRQDPPFNMAYITYTHFLDHIKDSVLIVNDPSAIRNSPEKLLVMNYPEIMPDTMITRNVKMIEEFREKHGDIVLKPLFECGGSGVYLVKKDDCNYNTIISQMLSMSLDPIIVQKFMTNVVQGDRRVMIVGGEPQIVLNRVPSNGDIKANVHAGAKFEKSDISVSDRHICNIIKDYLLDNNILFAGIDIIDGKINEINVTSPGCMQEVKEIYGIDIAVNIWDEIEKRLSFGN